MRNKIKELLRHSSVYSIGTISEQAVLVFFLPVLTTYLSPAQFGLVALVQLAVSLFEKLMSPFNLAVGRFYYNPYFKKDAPALIWNLFYLLCLKSLVVFGIFILSAGLIGSFVGESDQQNVQTLIMYFAFVLLIKPADGFLKVFCRLEQKSLLYIIVSFSQVIIYCASLVLTLTVFNLGVLALPVSMLIKTCVGLLGLLPFFLAYVTFQFKPGLAKEPFKYGYPLILSAYSNYLLQSGDRVILKMFCPLSVVGMYHIGYKVASAINFLLVTPVKQALNPIVLQQEANPQEQKYFLRRTASVYYGFILWVGLFFALFSRELVMLLARQEGYHAVWVIVPLIVFGYIQHGLGNFVGKGMVMAKKSFHQSGILVVSVLVNIGLNFILIPYIDILGAAIATVNAYIIWNYLKMYYSWKFYNLVFEYKRLVLLSLLWITFVLVGLLVPAPGIFVSIMFRLLLITLFPMVIFFSGILNTDEKNIVVRLLRSSYLYRLCSRYS